MNISWLSLRDLEYVVAIGRYQHFGKAAKACNVSQPAMSSQIKKIEELLGVTLFERTNRRVVATELGVQVVEQASTVLEEAKKIVSLAQKRILPLSGIFRLGAIATLGPYFIPHLLGPLKKEFPEVRLRLREGLTDQLLKDLREGSLDAVLAARTFPEDGFSVYPVFEEPFVFMGPTEHNLTRKNPVLPQDLNSKEMVLLEDGHCLRDQAIELCPPNKRGHAQDFHATSLETLKYLVANGAGYTLVPLLAARDELPLKNMVRFRSLDGKGVGRTIVLVCRQRYSHKEDVKALVDLMKRHLPSSPVKGLKLEPAR